MQAHDSRGWAKTNAVEKKYKTGKEKHGIKEEKRRDESRREKVSAGKERERWRDERGCRAAPPGQFNRR